MKKYIIRWNTGFGDNCDIIEAENEELADQEAYESWREEAKSNADYEAMPYTKEQAEDYGLED